MKTSCLKLNFRFIILGIISVILLFGIAGISYCETEYLIKSIAVEPGTPAISFRPEWKLFCVNVPNSVESVRIKTESIKSNCTITIDGNVTESGQWSLPVNVTVGRNIIKIDVVSPDGKMKFVYTVKVFKGFPVPEWIKVSDDNPFVPRDSAGEFVFKDKMWLIGGYIPELVNDIWSSSDGVNWAMEGEIPNKSGVNIPVNLVFKDKMWLVMQDGSFYSSENGKKWDLVTDNAPWKGRYAAGGAVFNERMWILGGRGSSGPLNDVWSSEDGVNWICETENAQWAKRQVFSQIVTFKDKMWLIGGGLSSYHPFRAYNDVWQSADGKKWKNITNNAPWEKRVWGTAAVYKNRLWVLGGFRAEPEWNNFGDVWYSPDGLLWKELICNDIWSPRHEMSVYVFKNKLWVIAGNSWPLKNDVWSLEIKGLCFMTQPVYEEYVGVEYVYNAFADFNESCKKITYRLINSPEWLKIDRNTGQIRGIPEKEGEYSVKIEASDGIEKAVQSYTLYVLPI